MSYTQFDRHAHMTGEVREAILDLIGEVEGFHLMNQLYGLFDGYLYTELEGATSPKIQAIVNIVKGYPVL